MDDIPPIKPEQMRYLQYVADLLEQPDPTTDISTLLVNTYEEIASWALAALASRESSMLVEKIVAQTTDVDALSTFVVTYVGPSWSKILTSPFPTRVLEKALMTISSNGAKKKAKEVMKQLLAFLTEEPKWNEWIPSAYTSKTLIHIIECLNSLGMTKEKIKFREAIFSHISVEHLKVSYSSVLIQRCIVDSYRFDEQCHDIGKIPITTGKPNGPPSRQAEVDGISSGQHSEQWEKEASPEYRYVFDRVFESQETLSTLLVNEAASHLIEVLIKLASKSNYATILLTHLKPHVLDGVKHPITNFVIQRLIQCTKSDAHIAILLEVIEPEFSSLFANRCGVILRILEAAAKHKGSQKELLRVFYRALCKYQGGEDHEVDRLRKNIAPTLIFLETETRAPQREKYSTWGCQLLMALFQFQPEMVPTVYSSFIAMPSSELMQCSTSNMGSRVLEAFFASAEVPKKSRQKMAKMCIADDNIEQLALDRSGCFVLQKCYIVGELDVKTAIAGKLVEIEDKVIGLRHGYHLLKNCNVALYKRKAEEWEQQEKSKQTKEHLFSDFIEEADTAIKAKQGKEKTKKRPREEEYSDKPNKKQKTKETPKEKVATPPPAFDDLFNAEILDALQSAGGKKKKKQKKPKAVEPEPTEPETGSKKRKKKETKVQMSF